MIKFKEKFSTVIEDCKVKTKEFLEESSDDIADIVVVGGIIIFAGSIGLTIINKAIPSRTNFHVYIHVK